MSELHLASPLTGLPKITKPQIAALKKLGLVTVQDLLFYFPFRYLDFSKITTIKELAPGQTVTIKAKIKEITSRYSFRAHLSLAEAVVSDATGSLKVVWFNQPYLKNNFAKGEEIFLAGAPEYYKNSLQLTNPVYEKVSDHPIHTSRLVPVYRLPQSIYPKSFRQLISNALAVLPELKETLPEEMLKRQGLTGLLKAVEALHFPSNLERIKQAKTRMAFEEIFISQLAAQKHKLELQQKQSWRVPFDQKLIKDFLATLPFQLTAAQKKAAWEILQDLEQPKPMNRLLEGDVGSGKTLVALLGGLEAIAKEYQVVFLAPTEILAKQHFETAKKYLSADKVALLTSGYSAIAEKTLPKARLLKLLREGMPALYIGTHAFLEEKVKFKNLALVIIDEQHRFGVEQRSRLTEGKKKVPHLLSLSATPIPRSLQLALFGDLDISTIRSKPLGRRPIITHLIKPEQRKQAYEFIRKQVLTRHQAFVITPLIEESDKLGIKAATSEYMALQKTFPEYKIGLLHGRLKTKEKEAVMQEFLDNKVQILVSTSVVEVGVDIPNASVMLIEGAERFGLAQLHQFRGRVGRSDFQSYCFVASDSENPEVWQRLEAFAKTQDGFELAELDLKLRGFGELYGQQQSGWNWKYFDTQYLALLPSAQQEAKKLLSKDPMLENYPSLLEKIKFQVIHLE